MEILTFESWFKSCMRPYVKSGSMHEKIILPWVEAAWKAAVLASASPNKKLKIDACAKDPEYCGYRQEPCYYADCHGYQRTT